MIYKPLLEVPAFEAGDETRLRELLHPKNDEVDLPYSLAHAYLPKGAKSLPHKLSSSETYHILSGEGSVTVNEVEQKIQQGDTFLVPSGAEQMMNNTKRGR